MKFLEKLKDRYNIIIILISIMFLVLSFRLATLTIVDGDYYRQRSDTKRVKEIAMTAPRGEIRDRNGKLIAGNKPSFTVQILKDELKNIKDIEKKNEIILNLIKLLEEDGVDYVDDFPIELNTFKFTNENMNYSEDASAMDKVIDIIVEKNLLPQMLDTYYTGDKAEHFQFLTVNKAIHALQNKGMDIPIDASLNGNNVSLEFDDGEGVSKWKEEQKLSSNIGAKEAILKLIDNDKNVIRSILDHPISRELTYELLESKGLVNDIKMIPYTIVFDEEYAEQKSILMRNFNSINKNSKAKDDFVNIVLETGVRELLENVIEEKDDKDNVIGRVVPGEVLIKEIERKGKDCPVTYEISKDNKKVNYKFKKKSKTTKLNPLAYLIEQGKSTKAINEMITNDKVKNAAQELILSNGVNPKISITEWEYVAINNKNNWYSSSKTPKNSNPEEAFNHLRKRYGIDENLSKYEARSMLLIYDQLNKQGFRAYQPINIAYGIKNSTVAKIEEDTVNMPGIDVSIEPVRYYPMGNSASHILGYLGKISQSQEIKKYVEEKKYSPNDIIGKTGVEEKFEDKLKGKDGIKKVEVDVMGNTIKTVDEKKPIPGNNLYLTIDAELQKVAEESLKKTLEAIQKGGTYESEWGNYKFGTSKKGRPYINATSGAVVALNVKTGEVLALANYPDYDPNLFATGISSADWESLFPENEKDLLAPRPLYNIALQTAIQPGSTYKMITALAALEKGLSPTRTITDMGYVDIGGEPFGCWIWNSRRGTHGPENLYDALRDSCNYYFYSVTLGKNPRTGEGLGMKVDIEDIVKISKEFGLNDKTGIEIDIPNESSGGVPDPERKITITKNILKNFLEQNLKKYTKEDEKLSNADIKKNIEEIISWTDLEIPLSRGEVYRRLEKMGIDPDKKINNDTESLTDKIKYTYLSQAGWTAADTLNVSIGQGENSYTPIQMANYVATIANGGYRNKVTVVDKIKNYNNSKVIHNQKVERERVKLNNYKHIEDVKLGMEKVVSEGTARSIFANFPVSVAAKTGTAEKSGINPATGDTYDDFAWFVAFGPYEDPEIAVAVVLFQGGSGGYAGPLTKDVIAQYLGLNDKADKKNLSSTTEMER